jgi:CPA1 family monovalent cation:H+ antiporter
VGIEAQVIGLMIVAVLVAGGARRMRVPYTVAMVLTGLAVSFLHTGALVADIRLDPHLILVTFLPGLLFEAAYHLDLRKLRSNIRTILMLAVPGILISMTIIGFLLNRLLGLPLIDALLFGVLISATDPIAVTSLFKELGVSRRLSIVVEGESLFNDGAAIVVYSILVGVVTGDQAFSLAGSITTFFVTVAGGAVLGIVAGLVARLMMRGLEDQVLHIALTAILAYGTYLFAEEALHGAVSPVIAVVVAAITLGNDRSVDARRATSMVTIISFWEFVVFLINSAIFLLIGLSIDPVTLLKDTGPVLVATGVILFARVLVVYPARYITNRFIRSMPARWGHVLFWGGLRGAVSMALALSLPDELASRELLSTMAFGYVLFSLIVQGLTIRPLLSRLGMTRVSLRRQEYEQRRARMGMAHAAVHAIDALHAENILAGPVCDDLRAFFQQRADQEWQDLEDLLKHEPGLVEVDLRYVRREIAGAQKQALRRMVQRGVISEEVASKLSREADEMAEHLHRDDWEPTSLPKDIPSGLPDEN